MDYPKDISNMTQEYYEHYEKGYYILKFKEFPDYAVTYHNEVCWWSESLEKAKEDIDIYG